MAFSDWITKALGWRMGTPHGTGSPFLEMTEMNVPPSWGYQNYLQAYGQVGWLFACVSLIAGEVAKVPWHLYRLDKNNDKTEIFAHPLIDFLNNPNPFYTRYQLFYLGTLYKKLVGEEFYVLNFDQSGKPAEIWLAPPAYMSVIPHPTKYIDHYEFKRPGTKEAVKFTTDEIIHIMNPNPYNPYRGISEAQALTVDVDSERFASRYQQKLFFNDATPGFVIKYPAQNMPPAASRQELMQEWDERFKGFRNRGKTAFLWGGEPSTVTMNNRDMDFALLRSFSRDMILGAYHIPHSVIGLAENVNRANAEAGHYTFAQYVIQPELAMIREALNKELTVFYGNDLYLDFENPVPEDTTEGINNTVNLFKAGIIKRNEARVEAGFQNLDGKEGDEFFIDQMLLAQQASMGMQTGPGNYGHAGRPGLAGGSEPKPESTNPTPPEGTGRSVSVDVIKGIRLDTVFATDGEKDDYWKGFVKRTETYEKPLIEVMGSIFVECKAKAIDSITRGDRVNLVDRAFFRETYTQKAAPPIITALVDSIKNGIQLVAPKTPHKDVNDIVTPAIVSAWATEWLKSRMGWAAMIIGETLANDLANALSDGFNAGESIPQLTARIEEFFTDPARAERIARTEIIAASNFGAVEGYRETGVVQKTEWYTAEDERVCGLCDTLNHQINEIGEGFVPPAHPDCRCVLLPVIEA